MQAHPGQGISHSLRPANLPSSLRKIRSSTLVYSTYPPVSVLGTDYLISSCDAFLGNWSTPTLLRLLSELYLQLVLTFWWICLPKLPYCLNNVYSTHCSNYPTSSRPNLKQNQIRTGILTGYPSVTPFGLTLGSPNPTLTNMALETSGIRCGRFSLPSRYSCRHSHFLSLQQTLQFAFNVTRTLPYHLHTKYINS